VSILPGIYASQITGHLTPTTGFVSIATQTVGSGGAASVTFSGIPQVYKHLQIRCLSRTTSSVNNGDTTKIRFNSDTATNYSNHLLGCYQGASSGLDYSGAASTTSATVFVSAENGQTSGLFAAAVIDILDYQNTNKYKTTRSLGGYDMNGSTSGYNYLSFVSGNWRSTAAITDITIFNAIGPNFAQYSSFALYGIQG
jgi:hypothetical protein